MKRLCIVCGKEIEGKEIICAECRLKKGKGEVIKEKEKESIAICQCLRYKKGKSWRNPPKTHYDRYDEYLTSILHKHYPSHKIESINEKTAVLLKGNEKVQVKFVKGLCDVCSRIHGGYYEGKVQLRGSKRFLEEKEEEVMQLVEKDKHPLAFVSKVNYLKEGTDIYIGSKTLINKLKKHFRKHETKTSTELYGVKDGKKIYRVTLLIREKKKGDANE